jgi:hypothetical protein
MEVDMSSFVTITAAASIGALAVAPLVTPCPPVSPSPQTADVQLAADSTPLGAIPAAFIRNQLTFCGLICPSIVQLATTAPIGAAEAPLAFVGGLQSGSLLRAVGAAAESVTSPADTATAGIINPDVFIVVPKAIGTTLPIVVVSAFNVGEALARPGQLLPTIEASRANILSALDTPAGLPPTELPSGANHFVEVATVAGLNVADAVAFRAGELLLADAVHTANVTATNLANTGNPGSAIRAGVTSANAEIGQARGIVTAAVDKAVSDVRASLRQPAVPTASPTSRTTAATSARSAAGAAHKLHSAIHGFAKASPKGRHRA